MELKPRTDFFSLIPAFSVITEEAAPDPICALCMQERRTDVDCDNGWVELQNNDARYNNPMAPCKRRLAVMEARKQQEGMDSAGLSDAQYAADWSALDISHRSFRAAREIAADISTVIQQGLNLVFTGPPGTGKTHAGVLVSRAAMGAGYSVVKLDWARFLDGLRDSYNDRTAEPEGKKLDRLTGADLLMLDDIGVGGEDNKFSLTRLEKIITRRYDAQRPTLLTANFTPQQLNEVMGDRAASRIRGRVMEVIFNGARYREQTERAEVSALVSKLWRGAGQ